MRKNIFCVNCRASLLPPPCGARKTLRAFTVPCVFRPLRKKRIAFFYSVRRSSKAPSSPRTSSVPPAVAVRFSTGSAKPMNALRCPKKCSRIRLLHFFDRCGDCGLASSATGSAKPMNALRCPKKCSRFALLHFFDRCGDCGFASSAAGSAKPQSLTFPNFVTIL